MISKCRPHKKWTQLEWSSHSERQGNFIVYAILIGIVLIYFRKASVSDATQFLTPLLVIYERITEQRKTCTPQINTKAQQEAAPARDTRSTKSRLRRH
jgi:hypothetical protein